MTVAQLGKLINYLIVLYTYIVDFSLHLLIDKQQN